MIWVFAIIIFLSLYLGLAGQQADKEEAEIWGKGITKWDYHEIEKGILEIEGECIGLDKIKSFRYKSRDNYAYVEYKTGEKCRLSVPINGGYRDKAEKIAIKKGAEEEKEAKWEARQPVLDFAKKNGVDLRSAYESRDMYLSQAGRGYFVSSLEVYQPTYTRGAVRGSFADQVSTLANAQKKSDYENQLEYKRQAREDAKEARRKYYAKAEEIISVLEKMPNSEEFVTFEKEQYEENIKTLSRLY